MGSDESGVSTEALGLPVEETSFFRSLVENSSDAIVSIDKSSQILYANQAVTRILGYAPEELIGEELAVLMPDRLRDEHFAAFERYLRTGERTIDWESVELPAKHTDGHEVALSITFEEHRYSDRRVFSGIMRDVSESKAREKKLRQRKQEITMLQQVFSRVFRHNIRNELSVAGGHIHDIEARTDDEAIQQRTTAALESIERLLSHAKKTREIERVVDTNPTYTVQSLPSLVSKAVESYQRADTAVTIEIDVGDVSVRVIDGFQTAIETAVENTIEHNPEPVSITVRSELHDETVDLRLIDDGHGIPAHEVAVLTEENETALSHGSGVGLWLMKWYVEKSDGKLEISGGDSGTEVTMSLKRASQTHLS